MPAASSFSVIGLPSTNFSNRASSLSETASTSCSRYRFRLVEQVGRNFDVVELRAQRFIVPEARLHRDEVDYALNWSSAPIGI